MSTTPVAGDGERAPSVAARMGFVSGMVAQELGWGPDVDESFRADVEAITGDEMVDEDTDEVVEAVVLWFREGDGDLADALVDAIGPLADNGFIWLLTPKRGRDGYVEPSDIAEAAPTAGLSQTSLSAVGPDWGGARLAPRKARSDKR